MHLTLVRAVSSHEPGRAELLLRPDIGAVRQLQFQKSLRDKNMTSVRHLVLCS